MKTAILAICFYRYKEIKESLESIISTFQDHSKFKVCGVCLPSPNSEKVINTIKKVSQSNPNLKFNILEAEENHTSGVLLAASLETDWLDDVEYVAVTETDIRLYTKGSIEKCIEYLNKYPYVSYMSPEYEVSDPYHLECKQKYIWPTPRLNEELLTTGARGFQILIWRKKDWLHFCQDVINGAFIENLGKEKYLGGILDGNAAKWSQRNRMYIGVAPEIKMLHAGWDVYRPVSQDQEYLDYKNNLQKNGELWAGKMTKGNEKINFTIIL